jgi:dihydrofolate reductase
VEALHNESDVIMAKVIAGMTISLDGYFEDASGDTSALYADFDTLRDSDYMQSLQAETGAVLMGRKMFELADPDSYADSYEFQNPLFVVTSNPPEKQPKSNENLSFTFVTDGVESAINQARAAAGDKAVTVVGGVRLIEDLLRFGAVDELSIDVMPVLLGGGRRLFDAAFLSDLDLELSSVRTYDQRVCMRYNVL